MATALQVTASTQQAVGAFNQLAASINGANAAFQRLTNTLNQGGQASSNYANSVTAINSAFSRMQGMIGGLLGGLTKLGAGLEFVFTAIIRELDKIQGFQAIMSVTTKTNEAVAGSYEFLRRTADRLGVQFDALTSNYAKLVAALPEGERGLRTAEKMFLGVAAAARTLHASNTDTQLMFYAITQIASKGVVSMEELRRQLGEKLPGVMQIAARALNTVPEKLEEAIRKGVVVSEKFLPIFGDALIRTFSDSADKASTSVSASINRLTNVWVDFVKEILDSGAGKSIAGVFDAIREKLSDPYVIERFAVMVKNLADRFAEFIQKLTADDIRNGFDTFSKGVDIAVTVVQKMADIIQWIINNGGKAGAIIGAIGGAAVGSVAGPVGMAIGAAGGAGVGAYAGYQLTNPSPEQENARKLADDAAQAAQKNAAITREMLKMQILTGPLQQVKGLNSLDGLERLFDNARLTQKTLDDLNRIVQDKSLKTDQSKVSAIKDYAKYGVVLGSQNATLQDVLGNGNGKKSREEKSLDATLARANGFNSNFQTEATNLGTLFRTGRLDAEGYADAVKKLISQQPFAVAAAKESAKEMKSESLATTELISSIIKQVEAREKLNIELDQEMKFAGLRGDALQVETQTQQAINNLRQAGIDLTAREVEQLRQRYQVILDTKKVTGAEDRILSGTVDQRTGFSTSIQALQNVSANGAQNGFNSGDLSRSLMTIAPDVLQNTQVFIDAQIAMFTDMYARIDQLRQAGLISDQAASQARMQVTAQENQFRLTNTSSFFENLSSLASSGNKRVAAVGKAAAIASATIDGIIAVQKALAAPPGWPYNAANVIAVGAATAANVAKIASVGFQEGGYTGNVGVGQVAGLVHGQEYVVNAAATRKYRATLEAMNAGRALNSSSSANAPIVNVQVINNSSGTKVQQSETRTDNRRDIVVMVEDIVANSVRRGGKVADSIESTYPQVNRARSAVR